MRAIRLGSVLLAAALLLFTAAACGDTATPKAATKTTTTSPPTSSPRSTSPPPATEMSAVSRDTQAKLTADGAVTVVAACYAATGDYRRCTTAGTGTKLGRYTAADWGTAPGQVSVAATGDGYTLDSRSYSGAHFVIEQPGGRAARRSCRDSVSECKTGTW